MRKNSKGIQIRKEVKLLLFLDDMIHLENPKDYEKTKQNKNNPKTQPPRNNRHVDTIQ